MEHLDNVDETYGEHFKFAITLSFMLLKAGFAALLHAVIPSLCVTTASDAVKEINYLLIERNAEPDDLDEDKELFI